MKHVGFATIVCIVCVLLVYEVTVKGEGNIEPPDDAFKDGSPISFMKTLNEVEPRIVITHLPMTITNSGSYYLTEPLDETNGSYGLFIDCDDVTIDLGGFGIAGDTNITSQHGIEIGDDVLHVIIKNGKIGDWGGWAIYSETNADFFSVEDLTVELTMQGGIKLGPNCRLTRISMSEIEGNGLVLGDSATITDCKINGCTQNGIIAGDSSTIKSCNSTENNQDGIQVSTYCTIRDCTVVNNNDDGIEGHSSCRILDNNIGNSINAGIHMTGPGNQIKNNNITANGKGIQVEGDSNWIENNGVIDNGTGIEIIGVGNFVIRNCVGTPLETNGVHITVTAEASNQVAEIFENLGSSFSNSNPWANIRLTEEQP